MQPPPQFDPLDTATRRRTPALGAARTTVPRPTFTGMAPRGIMAKVRAQKMPSVSLVKGLDPGRAAEHGFQIRKDREGIEVGMHKGEIFDIR